MAVEVLRASNSWFRVDVCFNHRKQEWFNIAELALGYDRKRNFAEAGRADKIPPLSSSSSFNFPKKLKLASRANFAADVTSFFFSFLYPISPTRCQPLLIPFSPPSDPPLFLFLSSSDVSISPACPLATSFPATSPVRYGRGSKRLIDSTIWRPVCYIAPSRRGNGVRGTYFLFFQDVTFGNSEPYIFGGSNGNSIPLFGSRVVIGHLSYLDSWRSAAARALSALCRGIERVPSSAGSASWLIASRLIPSRSRTWNIVRCKARDWVRTERDPRYTAAGTGTRKTSVSNFLLCSVIVNKVGEWTAATPTIRDSVREYPWMYPRLLSPARRPSISDNFRVDDFPKLPLGKRDGAIGRR